MKTTGSAIVDTIGKLNITGNVIPQSWYKTITKETGKPYLNAIVILSDIVYWYRPSEVRDEGTGDVVAYRKRFKSDFLQRSYSQIADQFGISKRDATNAIVALEKLGVVKRHFRKLEVEGMTLNNVLFIELIPSVLERLTYPSITDNESGDTYHPNRGEGTTKKVTPQTQIGDTNTEITHKTTQESKTIYSGSTDKKGQKPRQTRAFVPPTFDECKAYYEKMGYTFDLDYFYRYYDVADWHKANGEKVKNWKRCMLTFQHNAGAYDKPSQQKAEPKTVKNENLVVPALWR